MPYMKTAQTPAAKNEKWVRNGVRYFTKFWLWRRVRNKNARSCRSRLRHSRSVATSGAQASKVRGQGPPWILTFSAKKFVFLVSRKKQISSLLPPLKKFWKNPLVPLSWKKFFRRPCSGVNPSGTIRNWVIGFVFSITACSASVLAVAFFRLLEPLSYVCFDLDPPLSWLLWKKSYTWSSLC